MAIARVLSLLAAALLLATPQVSAELLSGSFEFKPGVTLSVGRSTGNGLRLDSVRFRVPEPGKSGILRTGGLVRAEVAVSNLSEESRRFGLAIALLDGEGRLVGVASGGTTVVPLKKDRQRTYKLVFDGVNARAAEAVTFQISLESRD